MSEIRFCTIFEMSKYLNFLTCQKLSRVYAGYNQEWGHAVAQLVEARRYKRVLFPMGSLDFCISIHTMALGSIQPLTEISTRNVSWE
jgi:hypothetical protein